MKPLEIVALHRSDDGTERPGEWRCGPTRARELMLTPLAAHTIDRLARLSAEIDLQSPHGTPDTERVTFAFGQAEDGRQHFAGVLVQTLDGRVLRHSPVQEDMPGTEVVWFLPTRLDALIASAARPEARPMLESAARPTPPAPEAAPQDRRPTGKRVADLIALGDAATFSDYAAVRSGRDAFSSMSLARLREQVGDQAAQAEEAARALLPDLPDATLAKVLRWVARGLPASQAARMTSVQEELAQAHRNSAG